MHLLFYISGHGFGHARRTAAIIRAILERHPGVEISVRTAAPPWIFTRVGLPASRIAHSDLDSGVVERDAMTIDVPATIQRVEQIIRDRDRIVAGELAALSPIGVTLIAADIPFFAADIAQRLGVPCVAMGNFTWDRIYEPYFAAHPSGPNIIDFIATCYSKMSAVLRFPFSHPMPQFPRVIDVPIVAYRSRMDRPQILRQLGFNSDNDVRPRILIAMRGGSPIETIRAAATAAPDFLFSTTTPISTPAPENLRFIQTANLDFSDLLLAHDAVISKLGYGLVADSIAARTRILWPRRIAFSEDALFESAAPALLPMTEISRDDYLSGRWSPALRALMQIPEPRASARLDGAETCADQLVCGLAGA